MDDDQGVIDVDDDDELPFTSHVAALEAALESTPHLPRDRAAVHLARSYAAMLDDAMDRMTERAEEDEDESRAFGRMVTIIAKIGPRYEAVLDKLGMSPGARPATRGGEPHGVDPAAVALEGLRSAAADGIDQASSVDAAVAEALASD